MDSSRTLLTFGLLVAVSATASGQSRAVLLGKRDLLAAPSGVHGSGASANRPANQGYLGIMIRDISENDVTTLHLKSAHGAEVTMVDHDGPACKAGLRERDIILSLNGSVIDSVDQLRRTLHESQPGRSVTLGIARNGAEQSFTVVLANREDLEREAWEHHFVVPDPESTPVNASPVTPPATKSRFGSSFIGGALLPLPSVYTGAKVDTMGAQLADFFGVKDGRGLLVHDVDANSPAAQAGLRAGDVVLRINTVSVTTKSAWMHAMRESKGHPVSLTVMRDRHEQVMTMLIDPKHRSEADPPQSIDGGWSPMLLQ